MTPPDPFQTHVRQVLLRRVTWSSALAAVLVPLGYIADVRNFPQAIHALLAMRLVLAAAFAVIFFLARTKKSALASPLSVAMTVCGGLGPTLMNLYTGGTSS